ncbi:MAG: DEAD/DEAH box helicase [Fibrobacter sp.]|nr:DEAD/DEAH box helicase [Fibrobacter sp.]
MNFSSFNLSTPILQGIEIAGFQVPTEIQKAVIPLILEGKDIVGCAPTGTGKTAAFLLPVLELLVRKSLKGAHLGFPQALLLSPTREIAIQTAKFVAQFEKFTKLKTVVLCGGEKIKHQTACLKDGADLIIATTGRTIDLLQRELLTISQIRILIIDEADKMHEMGFINDIRKIVNLIPFSRQTLLFSATMKDSIRDLMRDIQNRAKFIQIANSSEPVQSIEHSACSVPRHKKTSLLTYILETESYRKVLVFVNTKQMADKLARSLNNKSIKTELLHSDKSMSFRREAMGNFKNGTCKVLISTELAARGIDIDNISIVINYDTPTTPQSYIHRIGRTGRFQSNGIALTFYSGEEEIFINRIQYYTGNKIKIKTFPSITDN